MHGRNIFSKPSLDGSCLHIMLLVLFRSSKFRNAVISSSGSGDDSLTSQLKMVFQSMVKANITSTDRSSIINTDKIWELIGVDKLSTVDASELFIAMVSYRYFCQIIILLFMMIEYNIVNESILTHLHVYPHSLNLLILKTRH